MPMINVPLTPWTDIPKLKRSKLWARLAAEEASLRKQEERIKIRRAELKLELYDVMSSALPEGVKSVEYDYTFTDPETGETATEPLQFTKLDGSTTTSFKKEKLLEIPIPCTNPKCKAVMSIDADMIESCVEHGVSKPTVRVEKIKAKKNGNGGGNGQ